MKLEELKHFYSLVDNSYLTASKYTHYDKLNEWGEPLYRFLHKKLNKYGFINGGAAMGLSQPLIADFWFNVYQMLANICYSPSLKTEVATHHSSAYERNEAFKADLKFLIDNIKIS